MNVVLPTPLSPIKSNEYPRFCATLRLEHLESRTLLSAVSAIDIGVAEPLSVSGLAGVSNPTPRGYSPSQISRAYGFDQVWYSGNNKGDGSGQTIAIVAAYDAPFPDDGYKAGARQFPSLVPTSPNDPAHDANVRAWEVLSSFAKPFLCTFSDSDPITKGGERQFIGRVKGAEGQPHTTIEGAGHFLQEDKGEDLARVIADFIAAT